MIERHPLYRLTKCQQTYTAKHIELSAGSSLAGSLTTHAVLPLAAALVLVASGDVPHTPYISYTTHVFHVGCEQEMPCIELADSVVRDYIPANHTYRTQ